jgi:cytoskeletal protein RodZ
MKKTIKSNKGDVEIYWYVAYIILGIILLILVGVLIYYVFFKTSSSTPSPSLSSSPSPSPSSLPSSTTSPTTSTSPPSPTSTSKQINSILREQVKSWGDDFNSLPDDKKEKIRNCYLNPEQCAF